MPKVKTEAPELTWAELTEKELTDEFQAFVEELHDHEGRGCEICNLLEQGIDGQDIFDNMDAGPHTTWQKRWRAYVRKEKLE